MPGADPAAIDLLLTEASAGIAWPETPDLRHGVMARLPDRAPAAAGGPGWRPVLVRAGAVVAAIILIAASVTSIWGDAREAVADFFGFAVEGEEIRVLPTPAPGATETPFPPPVPLDEIGTPIVPEEAPARLGFPPEYPAGHGRPAAAYVIAYFDVPVLVLDYERFDLWESDLGVFQKFTKDVQQVEELRINGRPAYLISGGPHLVRFVDGEGNVAAGSIRTVLSETLIWNGEQLNYRLEFDALSRDEAVALAESLP